jgi:hypothetical protein
MRQLLRISMAAISVTVIGGTASAAEDPAASPRRIGRAAVATAPSATSGAAGSPGPAAAHIDPATLPQVVPLRLVADHLLVEVTFGEEGPHTFMLDTGAPTTLAEPLREAVGGQTIGRIDAQAAGGDVVSQEVFAIDELGMGGVLVKDVAALSGWVDADNPLSCLTENGLLGANAMAPAVWQLDYQAGTATLARSVDELEHIEDAFVAPFQPIPGISPTPVLALETGDSGLLFVLDTGSDAGLVATPAALEAAGIEIPVGAPTVNSRATGAGGAFDVEGRFVDVTFRLGDRELTYPVTAADIGTQGLGNAGGAFLSEFVVTIDWADQTVYFDPVSPEGRVDPPDIYGAGLGWDGSELIVASLVSGGPAQRAGLAIGDVITAVDGRTIGSPTRDDFCAILTGPRPATIETEAGQSFEIGPIEGFLTGQPAD